MGGLDNPGESGDGRPCDGGPRDSNNDGGGSHNHGSGGASGGRRSLRKRTGPRGDSKQVTKKQDRGAKNKGSKRPLNVSEVEIGELFFISHAFIPY